MSEAGSESGDDPDAGLQGTGLQGAGLQGTGLQGTGLQGDRLPGHAGRDAAARNAGPPAAEGRDLGAAAPGGPVIAGEEIEVTGIVQGVGFRPFVYRLAARLGVSGDVRNAGDRVVVRIGGPAAVRDAFAAALAAEAPVLARVERIARRPAAMAAEPGFRIVASGAGAVSVGVVPDVATCPACRAEIADPAARRQRYAFTNCTDCGPRFSIVTGLPYDRPATTMAGFALCPACRAEYDDPANRRFHAQPIACPTCGPRLWLEELAPAAPSGPADDEERALPGPVAPPTPGRPSPSLPPSPLLGEGREGGSTAAGQNSHSGSTTGDTSPPSPARGEGLPGPIASPAPGRLSPRLAPSLLAGEGGGSTGAEQTPRSGITTEAAPLPSLPFSAGEEDVPASIPPPTPADPIARAAALLRQGRILAVKGIGGYHIACDATDPGAVATLRGRKQRPSKPLAIMADLPAAQALCAVSPDEEAALLHPSAPILLLPVRPGGPLAGGIAPGQRHVGLMLPYTALHHLLLAAVGRPLVMTSANRSNAPQIFRDEEARAGLAGIVDALLMHDRPIARRLDDSVARHAAGALRVMRRGRGLAPMPLPLPEDFAAAPPVLALGGALKSALCLTHGARALLSHHLGDLDAPATGDAYEEALADYTALFSHRPVLVAVDLHPDYRATRLGEALAAARGLEVARVQHHHAHIAAAMAENGWRRGDGRVVGIALDGLGLGDDGTVWGAEVLVCDYRESRRRARLSPIPLAGGDAASREPWRVLLAHLDLALGRAAVDGTPSLARLFAGKPVPTLRAMMDKGLHAPLASSAGRLFDAVAALLGLAPDRLSHEGEAAMALEAAAGGEAAPYPFAHRDGGALTEIDPAPLWRALAGDLAEGRAPAAMAAAFHAGLAEAFAAAAARIAAAEGLTAVALSGGVFQNARLLEETARRIAGRGLTPLLPAAVPANDGGLAFGQAVVAAARHLS